MAKIDMTAIASALESSLFSRESSSFIEHYLKFRGCSF